MANGRWLLLGVLFGAACGLSTRLVFAPKQLPLSEPTEEHCAEAPKVTEETARDVFVGVYVSSIYALSLKDNRYNADIWVWFRWEGDEIKPPESFEIVGSRINNRECKDYGMRGTQHFWACKINLQATQYFDVGEFPIDDQQIQFQIEDKDNENHVLRYVADADNCAVDHNFHVPGWTLVAARSSITAHRYCSNFGDTDLPTGSMAQYSRFVYSLTFQRTGVSYFFKLLIALFVATAIALLALWIRPKDVDPRFGLGTASLFATVANEYVISGYLPNSDVISNADALHIASMLIILATLIESTVSLALYNRGYTEVSRVLDRFSFGALTTVFAAVCFWVMTGA